MLTAKDLLFNSLDYDWVWNVSKKMRQSRPSQNRKTQLDILLKAFGIIRKNARSAVQIPSSAIDGQEVVSMYGVSGRSGIMNRMEFLKTLTDFKSLMSG